MMIINKDIRAWDLGGISPAAGHKQCQWDNFHNLYCYDKSIHENKCTVNGKMKVILVAKKKYVIRGEMREAGIIIVFKLDVNILSLLAIQAEKLQLGPKLKHPHTNDY